MRYLSIVFHLLHSQHLRSREIKGSDEVGEKKGPQKNIFNFYLSNVDGKYVFQVCGASIVIKAKNNNRSMLVES